MDSTDTEPSTRLATRASVPAPFIETPEAPAPVWRLDITRGAACPFGSSATTETRSYGTIFVGSEGSRRVDALTRARRPFGAIAIELGGPTNEVGISISCATRRRPPDSS